MKRSWVIPVVGLAGLGLAAGTAASLGLFFARPEPLAKEQPARFEIKSGDAELAYLLVQLELRTRQVIGAHQQRAQSPVPGVDLLYRRLLAKNAILPAAVAGQIFAETVPGATGGRAWVKMVVDQPRNPKNQGDAVAMALLAELRQDKRSVERREPDAVYYAEPIVAKETCLICHGDPKGDPDPYFPQYRKDGWRTGEIIGAVVARVAPGRK